MFATIPNRRLAGIKIDVKSDLNLVGNSVTTKVRGYLTALGSDCKENWKSLRAAMRYRIKPKTAVRGKSGDSAPDEDDEEAEDWSEVENQGVLESWQFWDCMNHCTFWFKENKNESKDQLTPHIILYCIERVAKNNPEEKFLIHTQLFLHIEIDEIKTLGDKPELSPLAPTNYNGFSPELYMDLVFLLGLHSEFIEMIRATRGKKFSKDFLIASVPRIGAAFLNGDLSLEITQQYLITLANLTRGDPDEVGVFYISLFQELIHDFVKENKPIGGQQNQYKMSTIMKLIGIVCMQDEDCTGDNEIAELNRDYAYNPIDLLCKKSKEVFNFMFGDSEVAHFLPSRPVLEILQEVCASIGKLDSSQTEYVGICAYLAGLLLKKYSKKVRKGCLKDLTNLTTRYSIYKPKLTFDDYKTEIHNLEDFCQKITSFGIRKRYQDKWFEAFFQYPNILEEECGLKVIENLVAPNADLKVASMLVRRALTLTLNTDPNSNDWDAESDHKLKQRVSKSILSVLKSPSMKDCRDEWIKTVFAENVHSTFAKDEFMNELNLISTKIGAIEVESDPKCVAYYDEILYSLCFQNSMESVMTILQTSIRSLYFKALHRIKVFLTLPYTLPREAKPTQKTLTVIEEAIFQILDTVHELDPMCEYLAKGIPLLIVEGLVSFETVENIIQGVARLTITQENFAKLVKLILIYQQLVVLALSQNQQGTYAQFVCSMLGFTYIRIPSGNPLPFLLIREICIKITEMICEKNSKPKILSPIDPNEFKEFTLLQLGLIYIRGDDHIKGEIKNCISTSNSYWKDVMCETKSDLHPKLVQILVTWVCNTCKAEWKYLLSFLMEVVLRSPNYQNITVYQLVSDAMLDAKREWECRTIYFLKFYAYFVTTIQNSETENFKDRPFEQKLVFQTLITLMEAYIQLLPPKPSATLLQKVGQIFQQTLIVLLDLTEWIVLKCDEYEITVKNDFLLMLSTVEGKISKRNSYVLPIYQSINKRLNHGKRGIKESELEKNSSVKLVAGVASPVPVLMSERIFDEYVHLSTVEETMTNGPGKDICEKEDRDLYPFHGGRHLRGKKAEFKFS